jgi:hypothetical protein
MFEAPSKAVPAASPPDDVLLILGQLEVEPLRF